MLPAAPAISPERSLAQLGLSAADMAKIGKLPLFAGIGGGRLGALLAGAVVTRYERKALLFLSGEPASRFYIVLDGWLRLFRSTSDGQESTIGVFGPGESVAEAAILNQGVYPVSGAVIAPARLLSVPGKSFIEHMRRDPDLALNLLSSMFVHLRQLIRQVEQLTSRSSAQRVADFLLRLCPEGQPQAELALPLDKALVAARLGMQPETFSRSLARLRSVGVETQGSSISIADVARLQRFAEKT